MEDDRPVPNRELDKELRGRSFRKNSGPGLNLAQHFESPGPRAILVSLLKGVLFGLENNGHCVTFSACVLMNLGIASCHMLSSYGVLTTP